MLRYTLIRGESGFRGALVVRTSGEHVWVRPSGEEPLQLPRKGMIWSSSDTIELEPEEMDSYIDAEFERMLGLAKGVDVPALWQPHSAVDGGPAKPLSLLIPASGIESEGALALALMLDGIHFSRRGRNFAPRSKAEVARLILARTGPWSENWVQAGVEAARKALDGQGDGGEDLDSAKRVLRELALMELHDVAPERHVRFLQAITEREPYEPVFEAQDLLVKLGVWEDHEPLEAHRLGLALDPPSDALVSDPVTNAPSYVDLCDVPFVAIDEKTTRDVDDALWARQLETGTIQVHVAIADPSVFVYPGTPLWEEAQRRGASMYLPDRVVPMLPVILGEERASLKAGEPREALHFSWVVDERGAVSEFAVEEAQVRLMKRMTYEEAAQELRDNQSGSLRALHEAGSRMRMRRGAAGGLLLRQHEWKANVKSNGRVQVKVFDPFLATRELVSELMIATGALAGEYCARHEIPGVFRSQQEPERALPAMREETSSPAALYEVFRGMRRAELSTEPASHFMLGATAYTQVSSPLRRFADLVMHLQLKGFLRDGEPRWNSEELQEVLMGVDGAVRARTRVERAMHRYWVLQELSHRVGERVAVDVVARMGKRFLVSLRDFGVRELCSFGNRVRIGDKVYVTITEANPRRNQLGLARA